MATDAQIAANRKNSQRSTGPKSEAGKAAVRYNAVKHGLLAKAAFLPGEDPEELGALVTQLENHYEPADDYEHVLVDRIAASVWRLRRVFQVEAGLFQHLVALEKADHAMNQILMTTAEVKRDIDHRFGSETVVDEESHTAATKELVKTVTTLCGTGATLGAAFISDARNGDAFSKLARYETTIRHGLSQAIHELGVVQAQRRAREAAD